MDIQRYLDIDLTSAGIEAISEIIEKSETDASNLTSFIVAAIEILEGLVTDLSPENRHSAK